MSGEGGNWERTCVRDGRPGPIPLVTAANAPSPPQSLQEGTSLLPQLPQIKGSFVIWLQDPCPPLPALKIQSPFLILPQPCSLPVRCLSAAASAVARRLICSSHLHPKVHLSSRLPSASLYGLPRINSLALTSGSGRVCPVLSCNPFLWVLSR